MLQREQMLGWLKEPLAHPIFKYVNEITVARRIELLVGVAWADVVECGVGHNAYICGRIASAPAFSSSVTQVNIVAESLATR